MRMPAGYLSFLRRASILSALLIGACTTPQPSTQSPDDPPTQTVDDTPTAPADDSPEDGEQADTRAPETSITAGPSGSIELTEATFTFSCDEADCDFECQLGSAAWSECSSPQRLTPLRPGSHSWSVRARDAAGNVDASAATRGWTVDPPYSLTVSSERIAQAGLDPVRFTAQLRQGGWPASGRPLTVTVPRGTRSAITDGGDGSYAWTVTPASSGIFPVTVALDDISVTREALVMATVADGLGQPMLVAGDVNTEGYEDGATISPDGRYLFVQYGPLYFSGIFNHASICAEAGWSMYDLTTCPGKTDSELVFQTIGPYANAQRPLFPTAGIVDGMLSHLAITIPTVINGLVRFPTVFYGFRRQADGSFREPFKVAFDDAYGTNGPFGLSFQMLDDTHARFLVAWDNYFNSLGDDKPDIYHGLITMDTTTNLGDVVYTGQYFESIDPHIAPVGFDSHAGVQGNPHLYYDATGTVQSIWTDDEQISHDLTVYRLSSGSFPDGSWDPVTLPAKINTAANESQPFFTGSHLILNRDVSIVAHAYLGSGGHDYHLDSSWGDAVTLLASGDLAEHGLFGVGEPTVARFEGKTYLYFIYVENRSIRPSGRFDMDLGAAYVEIPGSYLP